MIDIKASREAYYEENIDEIICIRRKFTLFDAMAKTGINAELLRKNK